MTAPDWAALVQQTRDRMDQAEKTARDATPAPWSSFAEHGRDWVDEAWSWIGVKGAGHIVGITYPAGEEHDLHEADAVQIASWGSPDVALRMAVWARDVLDRHHEIADFEVCHHCTLSDVSVSWPCDDVEAVLRAWVPDLLTAAGVQP